MFEKVRPLGTDFIEVVVSPSSNELGTEGMVFSRMEAPVAKHLMGPEANQESAAAVSISLKGFLESKKPALQRAF